jgi:hypothetical protein
MASARRRAHSMNHSLHRRLLAVQNHPAKDEQQRGPRQIGTSLTQTILLGHSHQMARARPPPAAGKRVCGLRAAGALSFFPPKSNLPVRDAGAMTIRNALPSVLSIAPVLLALGLAACDEAGGDGTGAPRMAVGAAQADPVVARALHDPLMSDPDLARRSEANAAIAFADSRALPVLPASPAERTRAREAARSALLAGGAIPPMSPLAPGSGGKTLAAAASPAAMLAAAGAPQSCQQAVQTGFDWAARLSAPALIAPLGMVEEAAGSDAAACRVRAVRYLTAAPLEDALIYHDTLARRAGFSIQRYAEPEAILAAIGKEGEALRVHVRELSGGMTAVNMVFWINP